MAAAGAGAAGAGAGAAAPAAFGALIPDRPVRFDFVQTGADRYVLNIAKPADVAEIALFVMPGIPIPPNMGVAVYWAVPPCTTWDLLGVLTAAKPSAVFRTNWKCNHDVMAATHVSLGLKIESAETLSAVSASADAMETSKLDFAMQVANDLYNYMGSFAKVVGGSDHLVVPSNILERWMTRFKTKYQKDASFLKKKAT